MIIKRINLNCTLNTYENRMKIFILCTLALKSTSFGVDGYNNGFPSSFFLNWIFCSSGDKSLPYVKKSDNASFWSVSHTKEYSWYTVT